MEDSGSSLLSDDSSFCLVDIKLAWTVRLPPPQ